jgi:hypothetical protein
MPRKKISVDQVKEMAESDLYTFAKLISPERLYGAVHEKVYKFLMRDDIPNALILLPRGHMKSFCIAIYVVWRITKNPELTCLYLSATTSLAETQLYQIKNILTSKIYRRYWPDMVHKEEKFREKWSATAISVDHPARKIENVRDPSIMVAGLTTNTTGAHCDLIIADDVVVPDNAYTSEGRRKTASAMSQMASILNTGGSIKAVGTRYHPNDQYQIWKDQKMPIYNDDLEIVDEQPIWTIMEEVVEKDDVFLWPRAMRPDGKAFGFDVKELARIRALYTDRTQFYAQYYNEPNDPESFMVTSDKFQYYDQKHIRRSNGKWFYRNEKLNVYAAIDFAYSLSKRADYSAIVVIGIDSTNNIYVLDMDRFKTERIGEYFDRVAKMHSKWEFKKLRTEVTAAQSMIASDLKDKIREDGMRLSIMEHRPTGKKEERMAAALDHRYNNGSIWHFQGGYTQVLEEEVMHSRPQHDDLKDCLTCAIEIAVKPAKSRKVDESNVVQLRRAGGAFSFGGRRG